MKVSLGYCESQDLGTLYSDSEKSDIFDYDSDSFKTEKLVLWASIKRHYHD